MLPEGVIIQDIKITPLLVGTVFRIRPYLNLIDKTDLEKMITNKDRDFDPVAPDLFEKYSDTILEVLTLAIHNKKSEPPQWYKSFLAENCQWDDIHVLLNAVVYRMGTSSFYKSTTVIMNLGQNSEKELIAFQKNKKTWEGKALQV